MQFTKSLMYHNSAKVMQSICGYKLGFFLKEVRRAQGISQETVARAAEVSQPAIAQMESSKPALSKELIVKIGASLNLNSDFLFSGKGDIFRSNSENQLIKILMPDIPGEMGFVILDCAIKSGRGGHIIPLFLSAPLLAKYWKKTTEGQHLYAILLRERSGNNIIFRMRDKNLFVDDRICHRERVVSLSDRSLRDTFFYHKLILDEKTFKKIFSWKDLRMSDLTTMLTRRTSLWEEDFIYHLSAALDSYDQKAWQQGRYSELISGIKKRQPEDRQSCIQKIHSGLLKLIKEN